MSGKDNKKRKKPLSFFTADTSTFVETPEPLPGKKDDITEIEKFILLPSYQSDDVIALLDEQFRELFVIYRQKE